MTDPAPKVMCRKLKKELPGLASPPFPTDLGRRIHAEISKAAWDEWKELAKKILNEYRLNLAMPEAQAFLMQQCEAFLFADQGPGEQEFTPETAEQHASVAKEKGLST